MERKLKFSKEKKKLTASILLHLLLFFSLLVFHLILSLGLTIDQSGLVGLFTSSL